MFFELHGVGNKMWPGATSDRDELSVIIILEHGSFLSGAKTVKWGGKNLSAFQIPRPLKKKKCQNAQCIASGVGTILKKFPPLTTNSSIYEMQCYNNDLL